jgi:uncharacterized protein with ATP-grasp and redox domains
MPSELIAHPDCIPCALRQVLASARRVSADPWFHTSVLKRVMRTMAQADTNKSPAEVSFDAIRAAGKVLGVRDPYLEDKRKENESLLKLLPGLRKKVAESKNPIELAARLAVAGNIIDLGIISTVDVQAEIDRALVEPLAVDDTEELRESLRAARSVVYVLDNAGEIVLDRLLIEQIKRKEVTCIVRNAPVLNDVTMDDAIAVGLDKIATVVDPGSPMLGLVLTLASAEVQDLFRSADTVIAKGQANFETLYGVQREVFFLLRAKCPIVAEALGVDLGGAVVSRREAVREPAPPPRAAGG